MFHFTTEYVIIHMLFRIEFMQNQVELSLRNEIFPLILRYAHSLAVSQIQQCVNKVDGFEWVKKELYVPSYDSFSFSLNNNVFSVLLDVRDFNGISLISKDVKIKQVEMAKKYDMIPCLFPVTIQGDKNTGVRSVANSNGWNLQSSETLEKIEPELYDYKECAKMSLYEKHIYALKYCIKYFKEQNFKVLSAQDVVGLDPQIWIKDSKGEKSWVIIKTNVDDEKTVLKDSLARVRENFFWNDGYLLNLKITNAVGQEDISRSEQFEIEQVCIKKIHKAKKNYEAEYALLKKENVYNLLKDSIGSNNLSDSHQMGIYQLRKYDNLLLRIHYSIVKNFSLLRDDLTLVPIRYKKSIRDNFRLGLPLFHVDRIDSIYAKEGGVDPQKVIAYDNGHSNISIVRKVSGVCVADEYFEYFLSMLDARKNRNAYKQLCIIMDIRAKYGKDAVVKALNILSKKIYTIKQNELGANSKEYYFAEDNEFFLIYKLFTTGYCNSLRKLSALPQKTYDKAIKDILSAKDFAFDFVNPTNLLIDEQKQEFNFIDLIFEPSVVAKKQKRDPLKSFTEAILGKHARNAIQPKDLLFFEEDVKLYEQVFKDVSKKINKASKKAFKSL